MTSLSARERRGVGIVDLFSGPGGWDEGLASIGRTDVVGLEWDKAACQTAKAAGHARIRCDVAQYPTEPFTGVEGVIASPPCQAWSMAGKRKGEQDRAACHELADRMAAGDDSTDWTAWEDERSPLVCQPVRWVRDLRPVWVALEEVPAVASLWEQFARIFRAWGYSVWTGDLNSADYGVPQTRTRRILMAHRSMTVQPPVPTHAQTPQGADLFGGELSPWVSMAEALGWTRGIDVNTRGNRQTPGGNEFSADRPSWALTEKTRSWFVSAGVTGEGRPKDPQTQPADTLTGKGTAYWCYERPATTVVGSYCPDVISAPGYRLSESRQNAEGGVRVTVAEGGVLQSFPPDYPWDGLRPAPHVAERLSVKDHDALAHKLVSDGLQRGVHLVVRGLVGQDDKVLQTVVVLDAVDVVHDLLRLRVGDQAVLRYQRPASEDVSAVDPEVCGLLPALVRVERITVEPPLLPVPGAQAPRDGLAFAVLARWLGRVDEGISGPTVPHSLVVHETHALGPVGPVASFDLTNPHVSCYRAAGSSRTKQYQQVGNAIPPVLAAHVLAALGVATTDEVAA